MKQDIINNVDYYTVAAMNLLVNMDSGHGPMVRDLLRPIISSAQRDLSDAGITPADESNETLKNINANLEILNKVYKLLCRGKYTILPAYPFDIKAIHMDEE